MFNAFSDLTPIVEAVAAWLLTYGIHSTLLFALAAAVSRFLPLPSREALWKTALVGGLLTATLQSALAWQPVGGSWSVEQVAASIPALDSSSWNPQAAAIAALAAQAPPAASPLPSPAGPAELAAFVQDSAPAEASAVWPGIAVAFWILVGLLGSVALAISYRRFIGRLADRQEVTAGTAAELLEALRDRRRIRSAVPLFRSEGIGIPIAHGVVRGKICIPGRALELPAEEQESLLAHELAHIARRDPLWLLIGRTLERLFFFQPLHRLARRRLQEIAEFRCDDWASEATGRPLSLARCLTEVAGWKASDLRGLPATAMAVRESGLKRRVRRLLQASPASPSSPWLRPSLAVLLLAVIAAAPGFTGASLERVSWGQDEAATEPAPEEPPTPPEAPLPPQPPQIAEAPTAPRPPQPPAPRHDEDIEVEIPEIRIPEIRIPEIQIPDIRIPEIALPTVDLSGIEIEGFEMPEIEIPEIRLPEIHVPEIHVPEIVVPEIHIPAVEIPDLPERIFHLSELDPETREEIRRQVEAAQREAKRAQEELHRTLGPEMERLRSELAVVNERVEREVRRALEGQRETLLEAQTEARRQAREALEEHREEIERAQEEVRRHHELSKERREEIERAREEVRRHQERTREQLEEAARAREKAHEQLREQLDRHREERQRAREQAQRQLDERRVELERLHERLQRSREVRLAEAERARERARERAARRQVDRRLEEKERARELREREGEAQEREYRRQRYERERSKERPPKQRTPRTMSESRRLEIEQRNNEELRLQREAMMLERSAQAEERERQRQEDLRRTREGEGENEDPPEGSGEG